MTETLGRCHELPRNIHCRGPRLLTDVTSYFAAFRAEDRHAHAKVCAGARLEESACFQARNRLAAATWFQTLWLLISSSTPITEAFACSAQILSLSCLRNIRDRFEPSDKCHLQDLHLRGHPRHRFGIQAYTLDVWGNALDCHALSDVQAYTLDVRQSSESQKSAWHSSIHAECHARF